jgi:Cu+-exporting ATPase
VCALGLATPITIMVTPAAATAGVLFRDAAATREVQGRHRRQDRYADRRRVPAFEVAVGANGFSEDEALRLAA